MSATLQRRWLEKSPDAAGLTGELARNTHRIGTGDRVGHLWDDVAKPLEVVPFANPNTLAREISRRHRDGGSGKSGPTLVVLNTVKRAVDVWTVLQRDKTLRSAGTDVRLIHSRFRPAERRAWREEFLNRHACVPDTNRIIVSTQVVEAGVDISAFLLVTELAPWPSLVQRFGRCARWGGAGRIVVADFRHDSDRKAAPYSVDELDASRDACDTLQDVGPLHLEQFEEENGALLPRLYPYEPAHLLLRHEVNELFDTSPDLSGADIDISRFIRSGDERDIHVFWAEVAGHAPPSNLKPSRDELCSVPFIEARGWLCRSGSENLKPDVRAWVWDWLRREWRTVARRDIFPGQTVLVEAAAGGYRDDAGWDPMASEPVAPVPADDDARPVSRPCWTRDGEGWRAGNRRIRVLPPEDHADDAEDDESLSVTGDWQTIASHGLQVGVEVERIANEVVPASTRLLHLAGRWHDLGKAHPAFQSSMQADDRPARDDIAKAPDNAWPCSTRNMYRIDAVDQRRGFRHELASTLGLFGVLQRHAPLHPALIGPWSEWFDAIRQTHAGDGHDRGADATEPTAVEQEILDLGADDFDLLAYLVCAHHGKVRMTWHASPADQTADDRLLRVRGVRAGDTLPPLSLAAADGGFHQLPATALDLSPSEAGLSPRTGRSWTERVLDLVERRGPFTLAWLEALLRAADQRASSLTIADKLLQGPENDDAGYPMDGSRRPLAQPAAGGTPTPPPGGDSPPRRQLDGDGGRAGERGVDSGTTRPPHSATRYIETSVGILSYRLKDRWSSATPATSGWGYSRLLSANLANRPLSATVSAHDRLAGSQAPALHGRGRTNTQTQTAHRHSDVPYAPGAALLPWTKTATVKEKAWPDSRSSGSIAPSQAMPSP